MPPVLRRVLSPAHQELLREERRQLGELRVVLVRLDAPADEQKALARSIAQLDELFLLVVVGEFNAGKSAVINALLGERVLEEGVTPTPSRVGLLRHGRTRGRAAAGSGYEVITVPLDLLNEINIVDTPGTNAVIRGHEELTREFVPRSDLVLFVTSADRPFTESERAFLEVIRTWGKKVVVTLNKVDILQTPEDVDAVMGFVKEKMLALLGFRPQVFAVSARQAQRAKAEANEALLRASGFFALEDFVTRTLHETVRVRLKLLNPLGVGLHVLGQAQGVVGGRLALLKEDFTTLEDVDRQLALHREDLARDFRFRLSDVEKVLLDFEKRGGVFFDRTLRLSRILDLLNRERIRSEFEHEVVADLPRHVEKRVEKIVDWMVASHLKEWQAVAEKLQRRQAVHADRMVGHVTGTFEYDRAQLLKDIRRDAQRAVENYDHRAEAKRLAQAVRDAVAGTALLQVGALGLGAAVAALATTTLADVTGILAAGALSVVGLLLLPARRRRARAELETKVAVVREKLVSALTASFNRELEQSRQRVLEAMGPYSRFVRSEGEKLRGQHDELAALHNGLEALKERIEAL